MPFSEALVAEHNPKLAKEIQKTKFRDGGTFEVFRKNRYRKGLLYKSFNIKQIEATGVKPRPDERQAWLDIFDKFHTAEGDSSDGERTQAEARAFLRNESDAALDFEDKIRIVKGDLQGTIGIIKNFD